MKLIRTFFYCVITIGFAATFAACSNHSKNGNRNYSEPVKIHNFLYKITYNDYRFDENLETIDSKEAFGCSSVRNGNFYGRNFDYIYNDVPEFVVKIKAKSGRHASIGIATHFGLRNFCLENGKYNTQLELIPNFTLDGINDAGVICSHNVVPYEDVAEVTGTNPDGEKLHMLMIPRFILDNADSANHAVELLKKRNIYGYLGNKHNYLHIMIADVNKTYVVEFIDNKVIAVEKKGNEQIMTNYYVNYEKYKNDGIKYTEGSIGIERFNILQANYDEGSTIAGMRNLMQRVMYSKAYEETNYPVWYSEFLHQSQMKNINSPEAQEILGSLSKLRNDYWNSLILNRRQPQNPAFWLTVHNSTYDIEKRMLRVSVQEDYAKYYDFYLNDVK